MRQAAERNGEALRRIVPVLLALARFAERAGGLPFPVRFVLLAILGHAEAVIWPRVERVTWLLVETGADGRAPQCAARLAGQPRQRLHGSADAASLAGRLRMLAWIVAGLAARLLAVAESAARRMSFSRLAPVLPPAGGVALCAAPDTS